MIRRAIRAVRLAIIIVLTLGVVGTTLLWYRSHSTADTVSLTVTEQSYVSLFSCLGHIDTYYYDCDSGEVAAWQDIDRSVRQEYDRLVIEGTERSRSFSYFGYEKIVARGRVLGRVVVSFPHWFLLVLLTAYPTIAFIRGPLRRWRRRRKGLCLKCAYDLTGNVSGVCPECGSEVVLP